MTPDGGLIGFLLHGVVSAVCLLITAKVINGFRVSGFFAAFVAALVIGFASALVWPAFLVLGPFIFVINGAILKVCAWILPGFSIDSWFAAIIGSIVLSLVSFLLHGLII